MTLTRGLGLVVFLSYSVYAVDPLPSDRRITWAGHVGVPGGIPHFTNSTLISTTIGSAAVQAAINAAPQFSAICFTNAGSLSVTGNQLRLPSNKVLRSTQGTNTVITGGQGQPLAIGIWQNWEQETTVDVTAASHTNWLAGYAQGTTVITISNAANFAAGQLIMLDQLNDTNASVFGYSVNGNFTQFEYTSEAHLNDGRDRCQFQVNRISSINGNDITLEEPVFMPNYDASLSPQVWRLAALPVTNSGVENLLVDGGSSDGPLSMSVAYGCWFSNVTISATSARGYALLYWTMKCTVEHCQLTAQQAELDSYGVRTRGGANNLIENNWAAGLRAPFVPNSCSGSVWSYNFATNCQTSGFWFQPGFLQHGGFPNMNLYEGNWAPGLGGDNVWGGCSRNTWFRFRGTGFDFDPGGGHGNLQAAAIMSTNRHCNVIGCVLGNASLTVYQDDGTTACHDGQRVYYIGTTNGGSGCSGGSYDAVVNATLLRAVNWTSATATNNGVNLDGYVPADLPNSYYLAAKPAFFGGLPWPSIDPANPTVDVTNNPAAYRYIYGIDPPAAAGQTTYLIFRLP